MFDYKLLEALASVVHEKGFEKAARKLNITQSAVSQRVKLLEDNIGQILITRTSPPKVTQSGKSLLKHYMQVKSLEDDFESEFDKEKTNRFVSFPIGVNADSLATWFLPAVGEYVKENNILLDLKVDDQDQTHIMLKNGEVSGCISSEKSTVQGCNVTYIGTMTYRMAATKVFVSEYFKDGLDEDSLKHAPAVVFNRKDELHDRCLNQYLGKSIKDLAISYVPSSDQFARMVIDGIAYGMVPDLQGLEYVNSGHLVDLIPDCHIHVKLYWHRWNLSSTLLDEFSRSIVKNAVIC